MELTTPALLFPAISLLFLAYTNRFLVLAQLIRKLHSGDREHTQKIILRQIENLKQRIMLIRLMQALGVFSFILCALSMLFIFLSQMFTAKLLFGFSLLLLVMSLIASLYEIIISTGAIRIELEDLENSQ